jgi:hypothetical protein
MGEALVPTWSPLPEAPKPLLPVPSPMTFTVGVAWPTAATLSVAR